MSDSHVETANFTRTITQIKTDNPDFILFNGDLENDGVTNSEMDKMVAVIGDQLNKTFLVRGNHDDHVAGSASLWQSYFNDKYGADRGLSLPAGVTNYIGINSDSTYLTYSFDYGNSRFIGIDSNKNADPMASAQYTFLNDRLADAENRGLIHAFIFTHPPEYCVDSTHCSCQNVTGCGPSSQLRDIINAHPIVSATIHGHEHLLSWTHMSDARVPGLTHEYEEFMTSPAGNPYGSTVYSNRVDFYNRTANGLSYGLVDVDGANFTVSFYHVGESTPLWSKTFTKSKVTITSGLSPTITPTSRPTSTPTPRITGTVTPATVSGGRALKYYGVDRVEATNDANYQVLASHSVKTVVQYLSISSQTAWRNVIALAEKYNMDIVIFPNQGGDVSGCGWETPFNSPQNGDYIWRVKSMLDYFDNVANWPGGRIRVVGIVSSHEPMWNQGSCKTKIADLAAIKTQLRAYVNRSDFKVWSYIDNISDMPNITDFSSYADAEKIMDVAAIWQHCFGGAEGSCPGAKNKIINDRKLINDAGLNGKVDLVFLMQTFAQDSGYRMPTYDELLTESRNFLDTGALDGFIYYTWGACWYDTDLGCPSVTNPANSALWPVMDILYSTPTQAPIQGDVNGDHHVTIDDFLLVSAQFGNLPNSNLDLDGNGKINAADLSIILAYFGM